MDIFEDLAHGMTMSNLDSTAKVKQWIDGFVNDTSIFLNIDDKSTQPQPNEIAQKLQHNARLWEKLLKATGGKLELTKCFYYILYWKFDKEGAPTPMTKEELEANEVNITIHDEESNTITIIQHYDCDKAHRTLGLYKTLTGNQAEQLKRQETKVRQSQEQ
jgi:hypothetical protein